MDEEALSQTPLNICGFAVHTHLFFSKPSSQRQRISAAAGRKLHMDYMDLSIQTLSSTLVFIMFRILCSSYPCKHEKYWYPAESCTDVCFYFTTQGSLDSEKHGMTVDYCGLNPPNANVTL